MISIDLFKHGMRRLAAGVCVITALDQGRRTGLVATSVTSFSADPPSLLMCVNRSSQSHEAVSRSGIFCANILSHADADFAVLFSAAATREQAFAARDWRELETGAPALASAVASFDCRVIKEEPFRSHTIFVGEIMDTLLPNRDIEPLVYMGGSYMTTSRAQPRQRELAMVDRIGFSDL
jgi:flavin reductase